MTEIFTGLLLFIVLVGGLGLPITATMTLEPDERLCLGAAVGCVLVYLAAWIVYWLSLPLVCFWTLPVATIVATALRRRALAALFNEGGVRRLAVLWLLVSGWSLGLLTLIRSYSGGEWVGDWFEHYQRALFFLQHQPLDTVFLLQYPLPARPPLANLFIGALLALTKPGFAQFQIFTTLCGTLAFLPAAMLARRFRKTVGGDPSATLALLLMLCPLFVENTTFSWTKMQAVFFTLTGLFLFLKAEDSQDRQRTLGMAFCIGAALLTHYSAGPYAVILGVIWCWRRRRTWGRPAFWSEALPPLAMIVALLSTWFVWATWHYGSATFLSNTTVTVGKGLSFSQQLTQKTLNFFITIVPHPLRAADYIYVAQNSAMSWWRDYFFNIYQTNLPLACGSGSIIALAALIWRQRQTLSVFWTGFVLAAVLLNTLLISGPDRWGTVHVCLQPVVLIALAWLAASLPQLGRGLKALLAVGLTVDFILGIALHFRVQHLIFSPGIFAHRGGQALTELHGYATWNNFLAKTALHLAFIGDIAPPAVLVCGLLAALLGLTACLAFKKTRQPHADPMTNPPSPSSANQSISSARRPLPLWIPALLACAACVWLWICLCIFPLHTWNDVRLEPSFLLAHGLPVYPTQTEGAVTTWIYGPLPVILLWPATFAHNTATALLGAGSINLFFTAGMIVIVCAAWPATLSWRERLLAGAACVALWPAASFQYIQADNYAVACGLLANLLLMRKNNEAPGAMRGWLAAFGVAGAVMCKQTAVGLVLAQCLWLGCKFGPRVAFFHALRTGAVIAAFLSGMLAWFGPEGVWFNLINIPAHLPRTPEVMRRITDPWVLLTVHVVAPAILLFGAGRRIWRADAPLLLPALTWLCVLPAGIAGFMTLGGTLNSLQGLHYLLPPLILVGLEKIPQTGWPPRKTAILVSLLVLAVFGARIALAPLRPLRPITTQLEQAEAFARQLKGHIWFPWNPLITYYSEGRFYHAEDGMYVRFVTGYPLNHAHALANLPPDWTVTALLGEDVDWGIALKLQPPNAISIKAGSWILHFWPPSGTTSHEKVDLSAANQTIPPTP